MPFAGSWPSWQHLVNPNFIFSAKWLAASHMAEKSELLFLFGFVTIVRYILSMYMIYTWDIHSMSCRSVTHTFWVQLSCCPVMPCCVRVFTVIQTSIASLYCWNFQRFIKLLYVWYIHGIYLVYVRYIAWSTAPLAELARQKRVQSFDLDGMGSIPAIPPSRCPDAEYLLCWSFSIN
jgi:hypothetical protein